MGRHVPSDLASSWSVSDSDFGLGSYKRSNFCFGFGASLRLQLPSGVYASTAALTALATTGASPGRASYRRMNGALQARANITIELQQRKTTMRPVTHVQPAYVLAKVQYERAYRCLIAR